MLLQSIEAQIHLTLTQVGAVMGVRRQDHLLETDNITPRVNAAAFDGSKETEVLKESTGALCIGSVLIATVTFGATFAVPGGYIADDHSNGGSPILARRYALEGFIWLITCFAAAFALAAYVVLAPVAQNTCPHLSRTAIQSTGVHRDTSYSPETLYFQRLLSWVLCYCSIGPS